MKKCNERFPLFQLADSSTELVNIPFQVPNQQNQSKHVHGPEIKI